MGRIHTDLCTAFGLPCVSSTVAVCRSANSEPELPPTEVDQETKAEY